LLRQRCGEKPTRAEVASEATGEFTRNYALPCFDQLQSQGNPDLAMSLAATDVAPDSKTMRGSLPLWVGVAVYAVLIAAGNGLLNDPDTMWHITVGQWILDHRAVPETDVYSFTMRGQPWNSMYWISQVLYAKSYSMFGWSGPVALAAAASAVTFALLAKLLSRHLNEITTTIFVVVAFVLTAPHLLARPHVLALPVMVAWIGGLIDAADQRKAPSFWLLPLIALWANLHGGFIFGLMMVAAVALDAVVGASADVRKSLALRWAIFGLASLIATCCTPYGWNTMLEPMKILAFGNSLPLVIEFRPVDFSHLGSFEICMLLGIGFALFRGIRLPPTRILLLLGLLHMALSQSRSAEMLVLLAPLVLAIPLAKQIGGVETSRPSLKPVRGVMVAGLVVLLAVGTLTFATAHRYAPNVANSPVRAVTELKKLNVERVFNDYDFGGYLVANNVAPFIDGRTDVYGKDFFVEHHNASELIEPDSLFRLLDAYQIQATLLRTQSAARKLLDHVDGWQKIYSDEVATIHVRKAGALHTVEPAVTPTAVTPLVK
jgi:hypothetical protein